MRILYLWPGADDRCTICGSHTLDTRRANVDIKHTSKSMLSDRAKPGGKSNHVGPIDPARCVHSCITQRDRQIDTRAARIKNISNNRTGPPDGNAQSASDKQRRNVVDYRRLRFFSLPVGGWVIFEDCDATRPDQIRRTDGGGWCNEANGGFILAGDGLATCRESDQSLS